MIRGRNGFTLSDGLRDGFTPVPLLRPSQKVVHRNMIKVRQNNKMTKWNIPFPRFISAVNALVYPKNRGNFLLLHVFIFPQIP